MASAKTHATIRAIEQRLESVPEGSDRARVLESARKFKANWIELGEQLARVFEGKLYEAWGFDSFDRYVTAELRLRRETAHKLVRSYAFVQSARPEYLEPARREALPSVDVVDFISRKQQAEVVPPEQLEDFTTAAFDNGWTPRVLSQKWKSLTADDQRAVAAEPEDKSQRAVRKARELAERLNGALVEIPGLEHEVLDAVRVVLRSLDRQLGASGDEAAA